ncbi:MAG: metallophosphoesterase [Candidatus Aenigmatarchaeota archaeon]
MLVGIVSDTHDNLPAIEKAVEEFNERGADLVLHAGDYVAPFALEKFSKLEGDFHGVFGNNDGEKEGLKEEVSDFGKIEEAPTSLEVKGKRVRLTHKPGEKVEGDFDLLVNGHTHEPKVEKKDGAVSINPGEASGWLTGEKTVALVNLEKMEAQIISLD